MRRLAPHVKVAAAIVTVFAIVSTPRTAIWAFAAYAAIVAVLVGAARLRPMFVLRRLAVELPFVAFALLLPFVARGERMEVLGVAVSESGVWSMWNVLAKATLGLAVSVVLVATTPVSDLLGGLHRLRVPSLLVGIAGFMVRYGAVMADDVRRARIARLARGHDPRWLWQARATAAGAGTMFVRAFERGERVHLAMLARGYDAAAPVLFTRPASRVELAAGAVVPVLVVSIALVAAVA